MMKMRDMRPVFFALLLVFMISIPASAATIVVERGESLWILAGRHDTTMQEIRDANNLKGNMIRSGQELEIPDADEKQAAAKTAARAAARNEVKKGEPRLPYTESDVNLLSRLVAAESCRQPYAGQVAVVAVVLNRVESPQFPNTIKDVVYARNQFTPVQNGYIWRVQEYCDLAKTRKAVMDALYGADPTSGAVFYYNPAKVGYHSFLSNRPHLVTLGDHRFTK